MRLISNDVHTFVRKLITEWRRLQLPASGRVVIAVSGGADSVSLLLAVAELVRMKKLDLTISAAHFDHGLRGAESDADAAFVKALAERLGVAYVSQRGKLTRGGDLEQKARNARYAFLEEAAADAGAFAVMTGHTVNDQAETFLINLIRGSGPTGLRAMPADRRLSENVRLVRPLLRWAMRRDTELFCAGKDVAFRSDAMNDDLTFRRVRIRKEVLPLLAELNPKIIETLAATAEMMPDEPTAASDLADELPLSVLRGLDEGELGRVIRMWLGERRGSLRRISREHIAAIARLSLSRKSGREIELPGGGRVVRSGGKLSFAASDRDNKVEKATPGN